MNERTRWTIILLATMALWASYHTIGKLLLRHVSPLDLSFFRVLFSLLFFVPYLAFRGGVRLPKESDLKYIAMNAGIGVLLAMFLNATGLSLSTASASAVIINVNPLLVAAIGFAFMAERLSKRQWLGLLTGFAGMALVVTNGNLEFASNAEYIFGNLILIAGALCVAMATVAALPLAKRFGAVQGQFWGILPAVVGFAAAWLHTGRAMHLESITAWDWAGLLFVGVVASGICWSVFFEAIRKIGPTAAASFKLLIPVFAVGYAALFLNETPTPAFLAGLVLVLCGVWAVNHGTAISASG